MRWAAEAPAHIAEGDDLAARVRRVLDEHVNPAVAAHRGHVTLAEELALGAKRFPGDSVCHGDIALARRLRS